jgi:hypothetical protein
LWWWRLGRDWPAVLLVELVALVLLLVFQRFPLHLLLLLGLGLIGGSLLGGALGRLLPGERGVLRFLSLHQLRALLLPLRRRRIVGWRLRRWLDDRQRPRAHFGCANRRRLVACCRRRVR